MKRAKRQCASLSITISVVQCRPAVYIGQKAVLAVTGSGGPAGGLAVLDSSVTGVLFFSKQPARSSIATAALTAHCLSTAPIGILHLLEWLRNGLGVCRTVSYACTSGPASATAYHSIPTSAGVPDRPVRAPFHLCSQLDGLTTGPNARGL